MEAIVIQIHYSEQHLNIQKHSSLVIFTHITLYFIKLHRDE